MTHIPTTNLTDWQDLSVLLAVALKMLADGDDIEEHEVQMALEAFDALWWVDDPNPSYIPEEMV